MSSPLPRRRFLQLSALASCAGWASASAAESGLELGFNQYGMKTLSTEEAIRVCAEIGYRNVEFALNPGYTTELSALTAEKRRGWREQLTRHRLRPSAFLINFSLAASDAVHAETLQKIATAGTLARELDEQHPPLIETVLGGKPGEWETLKTRMAERLQAWAEAATAAKATVAIKAHVNSAVNTVERLSWLLEQVKSPAIVVNYDYSHFELAGLPLAESLRALFPRTRMISVKDSVGDAAKFQFVLPGQGRTDYTAYFALLRELGYRGPVVVEVSAQVFNQPGYDPIRAARESYAHLAPKLAGA